MPSPEWTSVKVTYKYEDTVYNIMLLQDGAKGEKMIVDMDGVEKETNTIGLVNDFITHTVKVWLPVNHTAMEE